MMNRITGIHKSGQLPLMAIACLCFGMMLFSCAKQGFPPGGPADETPPELSWSVPERNATNVPGDKPIVFSFSEVMDKESVAENLFIVPVPAVWPQISWKDRGKILVITPSEPLDVNTTYVFSLGAKSSDRQRNTLKESVVLPFSTGNTLENIRVAGRVLPLSFRSESPEKVAVVDVIAYRLEAGMTEPDPSNDVPAFFTQTGIDGSYELAGLSQGKFRLFAVGDKDGDGFYTEGYDMIGIAPYDVSLAGEDTLVTAPAITLSMRYTAEVQFNSVRVPDSRRIELFFDRAVDPATLDLAIPGLDVQAWVPVSGTTRSISVSTGEQKPQRYEFEKIDVHDHDGNGLMEMDFQPFFDGTDRPDTSALTIASITPDVLTGPDEPVHIKFNRILDDTADLDGLIAQEGGGDITVSRSAPDELTLSPVEDWHNGMNYIILLDREKVRGTAGNLMTETGAQVEFRVVPADTLSSMSGTITGLKTSEGKCILSILNTDINRFREIPVDETGAWETGPLFAGKYVLYAHMDKNDDGEIFAGTLKPFEPAEQVTVYPDTVVVEPRWPVEDINIEFK